MVVSDCPPVSVLLAATEKFAIKPTSRILWYNVSIVLYRAGLRFSRAKVAWEPALREALPSARTPASEPLLRTLLWSVRVLLALKPPSTNAAAVMETVALRTTSAHHPVKGTWMRFAIRWWTENHAHAAASPDAATSTLPLVRVQAPWQK